MPVCVWIKILIAEDLPQGSPYKLIKSIKNPSLKGKTSLLIIGKNDFDHNKQFPMLTI